MGRCGLGLRPVPGLWYWLFGAGVAGVQLVRGRQRAHLPVLSRGFRDLGGDGVGQTMGEKLCFFLRRKLLEENMEDENGVRMVIYHRRND